MIDLAFTWQELRDRRMDKTIVVVADILRATTVMVTALTNGADAILPQAAEEDARNLHLQMKDAGKPVLICGERGGLKIPGFDLGNSPREFTPENVAGKTIIHLTTNGTKALNQVKSASAVFIAAFLNRKSVAQALVPHIQHDNDILLAASGKEGFFCLEDTVCLGGIIEELAANDSRHFECSDAAVSAQILYQAYHANLKQSLPTFSHARYLAGVGLADDLPLCAELDTSTLVPILKGERIVKE